MFRATYRALLFSQILAMATGYRPLIAQTQVDLHTQSKGVDFQNAPYTRPLKTSSALPSTCTVNELLLLTSAPAGSNLYMCLTANTWSPQTGTLTIQNQGTAVGSQPTANFVPGTGIVNTISNLGTSISIQQGVDTGLIVSQEDLQSGTTLLCNSASGSNSTYTCQLSPTLTAYTTGMILYWKPDVSGAGGAITLNVDLLGATPVVKADGSMPGSADIAAGELYPVWYDGTSFRLIAMSGGSGSGGGSSTPTSLTSTNAGGPTTITATSEWHSMPAYCSGASSGALVWNTPPTSAAPATAAGCSGANVNDAYAVFANVGTPSLQTSFLLPQTLTGNADVYIAYLTATAGGTFTPALDIVCTAVNSNDDPAFTANNFFAPAATIAPVTANTLGIVSARGISWPSGCTAGARAHLRLIRTDTTGTATNVNVAEVVITLRRTL